MKNKFFVVLVKTSFLLVVTAIWSQEKVVEKQSKRVSNYDYSVAFGPNFYSNNGSSIRSASGQPGYDYWQNKADYNLIVDLNQDQNQFSGEALITYTNNSPDEMNFLWLYLEQNLFKNDSRANAIIPITGSRNGAQGQLFDGGNKIEFVKVINSVNGKVIESNARYLINDTRMQVFLPEKLKSKGGVVKLKIGYSFISPKEGSDRMGVLETKNGKIFTVAQWYPRMCVYDDIRGWNTNPYLGASEFYLDYGDYNVYITVPSNHFVVSSGELVNKAKVLTLDEQKRLTLASQSDSKQVIRSKAEVISKIGDTSRSKKTWHFSLKNARDFAWASSPAFIVDAAKIDLPSGKKSLAISAYPIESYDSNSWSRSTEFVKATIENYSKRWYEYPYPTATNVAGIVSGMEYPAMSFSDYKDGGKELWGVTDHEFGHSWFPMIVGSNERLNGWMDEGLTTFINNLSTLEFNNGEFKNENLDLHHYASSFTNPSLEPVMNSPDNMKERNMGTLLYNKPSLALKILREQIIGKERYDLAFRTYIKRWAFKHPTPDDFFRTIENVSGEDLAWFWRAWFYNNWQLDQGINSIKYVKNDPKLGSYITIGNFEKMAMPVILDIKTKSGITTRIRLPVEVWQRNKEWTFKFNSAEEIESIVLDPDHDFPDSNDSNTTWTSNTGIVEKDIDINDYLGIFTNKQKKELILISKSRETILVSMPKELLFSIEYFDHDTFKSTDGLIKLEFTANKKSFTLIKRDGDKILYTKE